MELGGTGDATGWLLPGGSPTRAVGWLPWLASGNAQDRERM
jgi:hypothetical protein